METVAKIPKAETTSDDLREDLQREMLRVGLLYCQLLQKMKQD